MTKLDIAIIGGGSAGMTLARNLSSSHTSLVTKVFEPKTPTQRDCCWSFWSTDEHCTQITESTKGHWKQWRLVDECGEVVLGNGRFGYTCLSSAKYLQSCEDSLSGCVSLTRSKVDSIERQAAGGEISVGDDRYQALKIYDSRPSHNSEQGLRQHFVGWEIKTSKPLSNTDMATLMDFRVDQSRGLHFIYALPFSDNHLLIESTMISQKIEDKQWYQDAMASWLKSQGIEIAELIREEVGVIPMEQVTKSEDGLQAIGASSGAIRLSSGYGFSSIQSQMHGLAMNLSEGNDQVPQSMSTALIRMDKIFNNVLLSRPDLSKEIFMRTARALDGDEFARFMLGSASIKEWLKVILSMPKAPFIKQLWNEVVRG
jgi:lycopene beta-cyclase